MKAACCFALGAPILLVACWNDDREARPYQTDVEVFVPAAEYIAALDTTGSLTDEACIDLCRAHQSDPVLGCQNNGPAQGGGGSGGAPSTYSLTCTVEREAYCD